MIAPHIKRLLGVFRRQPVAPSPYYQDQAAGITVYCGRCEDILPVLPPVDAVITDPPYSEHTHKKQWIGAALTAQGAPRCSTAHKGLGFDPLTPESRRFFANQYARLARRWVLTFSDIEGIGGWIDDLKAERLEYVRTCIWDKVDSAPQFTGDRPAAAAEAIICAHRRGKKEWNGGGRRNVFRYAVNGAPGPKPHPSTKPLPLMLELVELFTNPGELILDSHMGSGTTLVAAKRLVRRAIGIEKDPECCRKAVERLDQTVRDRAMGQEVLKI